jgi:hypothetical protein
MFAQIQCTNLFLILSIFSNRSYLPEKICETEVSNQSHRKINRSFSRRVPQKMTTTIGTTKSNCAVPIIEVTWQFGMQPLSKILARTFTYQKSLIIAFLDSSHKSTSICHFNFLLNPKFDQVMAFRRRLTSGDQKGAPESFRHQLCLTKARSNSYSNTPK